MNVENVIVILHDGNFGRMAASNLSSIETIIVNNKESFDVMVKMLEQKTEVYKKDITPKLPGGHPLNDWMEKY